MPRRSTVVIELTVCRACCVMFLTIVPSRAGRGGDARGGRGGSLGLGEHDVRPAGVVGGLQVGRGWRP